MFFPQRGDQMPPDAATPRAVLFAYDGSDHAMSAIAQAGRLLGSRQALVLTVWQPLGTVPFFGGVAMPSVARKVVDAAAADAQKVAAEGVELASAAGFEAEAIVDEGSPVWSRIIEVANARDAAVVVLGSHGRSGVGYAAMGSVATSVAHHIARPVLITRLT
jgi:nucleotide-binding universal stress UspA family protein